MQGTSRSIKKRIKDSRVTSKKSEHLGLCTSCKAASACTYPKNIKKPVGQCEEFVGYELHPERAILKNPSRRTHSKLRSRAGEKNSGSHKGLCLFCEDNKTCTFPKTKEGVWDCEEYR